MGAERVEGIGGGVAPSVNDVFNRASNKYISGMSRPLTFVTAVNYTLPRLGGNRLLSMAIGDWTIGAMMQYASGMPIQVPLAQNKLSNLLFRGTFANRVPGEPLFTKDLNCHDCYDPTTDFVLNPKAWVDPADGQFGNSAAYYNDYRQQRRPSESMSIGRIFRIKEGLSLSIRGDFQNVFNRLITGNPSSTNAKAPQTIDKTGQTTAGFGDINTQAGTTPRAGMIVARFLF